MVRDIVQIRLTTRTAWPHGRAERKFLTERKFPQVTGERMNNKHGISRPPSRNDDQAGFLTVALGYQFNVRLEFLTKLNGIFRGHVVVHPVDDLIRLIKNL